MCGGVADDSGWTVPRSHLSIKIRSLTKKWSWVSGWRGVAWRSGCSALLSLLGHLKRNSGGCKSADEVITAECKHDTIRRFDKNRRWERRIGGWMALSAGLGRSRSYLGADYQSGSCIALWRRLTWARKGRSDGLAGAPTPVESRGELINYSRCIRKCRTKVD